MKPLDEDATEAMDSDVAVAVGAKALLGFDHHEWEFPCGMRCNVDHWNPSTDLEDAFWAAEKAGIWDNPLGCDCGVLRKEADGWVFACQTWDEWEGIEGPCASGRTPAEAICRAILEFTERTP